ncbi:MAG: trypsin-like serine protease [Richelia sp. RM2_1_2]|nr:trypsin-like serine protease [Richelia sp. SM1_7_0]NJO58925.1 trypsin-like serine protease [Richelia sp. RM2_1_2]
MNKKFIAFLISGLVIATTISYWASVQAQTQVQIQQSITPLFISADKANVESDRKPFIPPGLGRSAKPNEGDTRGIPTGIDNRIPMLSRKYPWSAIGRVKGTVNDGSNNYCTGTLIADNLVLTNAHCVIDPETGEFSSRVEFMPNVIDKIYQDIARVEEVTYGTDFQNDPNRMANDWAIMKINQPLGRKYGYLGWKSLPSNVLTRNKKAFFFVGYSGDFPTEKYQKYFTAGPGWTASYEAGCSITGEETGSLLHDCATAGGSSGGGIIGVINNEPYIVALNNAELKNTYTGQDIINFAVKISTIEQALNRK